VQSCASPSHLLGLLGALTLAGCNDRGQEGTPSAGPAPTVPPAASPISSASATAEPPQAASAAPAAALAPIRLAFVGDIALNYSIATDLEALAAGHAPKGVEPGFPFAGVAERLRAADIAVGNLECVVSTKGTLATWHKPFRAPLVGTAAILASGIDLVSVANNHSWDFGKEGFYDMLKNLDDGKLPVIGRGYRQNLPHEPERALVREVRGTRVGFLGYYLTVDANIQRDVAAASKEADVVVVYFHWGREKQSDATPEQKRQARAAIDAGADLVVGSHVHVLQPTEVYRSRLIAYGLGNFVFMGMNHEERFRRGAILEVAMHREQLVSYELVPTRVDDRGAPRLVTPESSYLPHQVLVPASSAGADAERAPERQKEPTKK
jgi:hypothetical protein